MKNNSLNLHSKGPGTLHAILKKRREEKNQATDKHSKPREPYDPFKHGISQTLLATWLECVEKARLRYYEGVKPTESKIPFMQGNIYHSLLEHIYLGIKNEQIKNPIEAMTSVQTKIKDIEKTAISSGKHVQLDVFEETLDLASVLIPAYFMNYDKDFTREWVYVESELSFPVHVDSKTVVNFKLKLDGGFNTKKGFWVLESKFKSRWPENIADFLPLDLQTCAYTGAAFHAGHKLLGCEYNIVRKPQLKRKKDEGRKEFLDRVREDITDRPNFYFERHDVEFSKAECEANLRRVKHLVTSFLEWWKKPHKEKDLGFNSGSCENKFGTCEFLPICGSNDWSKFSRPGGLRH